MELKYFVLVILAIISTALGDQVRVTTIEGEPYVDKQGTKYTGFIPDLMEEIGKKAGIDYKFRTVRDGKYGSMENDRWNGMVGELLRSEADIAAAPLTISRQRKEAIDFSEPFMSFGTTIVIKRPDEGEENPITSAEDLADQSEIGYGIVRDGETERFFKDSTKKPYKQMWQYMTSHPDMLVDTIDDGIAKVRESDGKYAFIIESSTAEYWTNIDPCDLIKIGENFNPKSYGFAVRKNDPMKGKINKALKALKDEGKVDELRDKYWNTGAQCDNSASTLLTAWTWIISLVAALIFSR